MLNVKSKRLELMAKKLIVNHLKCVVKTTHLANSPGLSFSVITQLHNISIKD